MNYDVVITVVHGDMEEQSDTDAIQAVHDAAEPFWRRTVGTNDTTTFFITSSGLHPVLRAIDKVHKPWWRWKVDQYIERRRFEETPPL